MKNEYFNQLRELSSLLVTPERQFPPRTPHSYSHLGQVAVLPAVTREYPDLPEVRHLYTRDTETTLQRMQRLGRIE